MSMSAEFTVEPFTDGKPGPHVQAAIEAAVAAGGSVEIGPFGTNVSGDDEVVLAAIDSMLRAAMSAGANRVTLQVTR
ncbi:MAG: hypothetical protein GXP35_14270 [Actinobacteria bacterium]|nr:hypothetical protein [Actinomycetota bacterium]